MQIPLLAREKSKKEAVLVFDIGTGSAAAGVALTGHDGPVRIAASRRFTLSHEERTEAQRLSGIQGAVLQSGKLVIDAYAASPLFKQYGAIKRAEANIHAPWTHARTDEASETFKAPRKITKEMVQSVGKSGQSSREEMLPGHEAFERHIIRVELNGYPTGDPIGKEAASIRTLILKSTIQSEAKEALSRAISDLVPGRNVAQRGAVFTHHRLLKEAVQDNESYLFVDMTSEASACTVVHHGTIQDVGNVPAGWRTLARAVAEKKKGPPAEALSLIGMVQSGTCSDAECAAIEAAIVSAEQEYMKAFGTLFSSFTKVKRLPNTLYIAVHPRLAVWAKHFFARIDFSQFTEIGKPFTTKTLSSKGLSHLVVYTADARADAGISAVAALL